LVVEVKKTTCRTRGQDFSKGVGFGFTVFNATFNNISVIPWQSILWEKETGVPGEDHHPVLSHWQT